MGALDPGQHRVRLAPLGVGLAAAGLGAALGLVAERAAMGRPLVPGLRGTDGEQYGMLHGRPVRVVAGDGTRLHVEVDEAHEPHEAEPARVDRRARRPLTVIFSHGYSLSLDSWHFQRKALRGRYRLVFWDQRGHGRSAGGPEGSATIDQVGRDLKDVIAAVAPSGPLVLVGHSMGGMTIMSYAQSEPDAFAERVIGVAFLSTSAAGLGDVDFGMPRLGKMIQRLGPGVVKLAARSGDVVERGREIGSDFESVLVRRFSFASPVSPELVEFAADMIGSTRVDVMSEYFPTFGEHDKREALAALHGVEVLVLVGDHDLLTPAAHSEEIVRLIPSAEHVVVRDGGHLLMLEHPDVVNSHLAELIARALRSAAHPHRTTPRRRFRVPRTVTPVRP